MQHSKAVTGNLVQYIEQHQIDIVLLQEPYYYNSEVVGFLSKYRLICYPSSKPLACILIINPKLPVVFIDKASCD